jgi:hypothetical protein
MNAEGAMVFEHGDCRGESSRIDLDKENNVAYSELNDLGIKPNHVSSVMVPLGYSLTLFKDGVFKEES